MKKVVVLLPLLVLLSGCWLFQEQIPPDPGTFSPPHIEDPTLVLSGGISLDTDNPDRVAIRLNPIINPSTGEPYSTLKEDEVMVAEDSLVQGILIKKVGEGVSSIADIVFIIDVTGSMGEEIDSVKASVLAFAEYLKSQGFDLRLGAVAYTDSVIGYTPLTENYTDSTTGFYHFIKGLYAGYMGDNGNEWPENGLDAIYFAYKHFSYRGGVQKIFILITDAPLHGVGDGDSYEHNCQFNLEMITDTLSGNVVVNVVSPDKKMDGVYAEYGYEESDGSIYWSTDYDTLHIHPKDLATKTGGKWVQLPYDGNVDLSVLPIGSTITESWVILFESEDPDAPHDVWVQIYKGSDKGEIIWRHIVY